MVKLRVLIVGAGASGLPAIKCCLDEGLDPVCLERSADIGGLWNYDNSLNSSDEIASVMRSTIINTCKEMMCYSDFPIPAEYPNFMHNKLVLQYLRKYADAFKLNSYIQLNTEVVRLSPSDDFAKTGQWKALIRARKTNEERTEIFDAVMVCTGHHAKKYMARFDGEENFKGARVHTHDFHDARGYDGKRVVVIGIGNSGGDVAVELSRICSQVYLSTRRGSWVTNRISDRGIPVDYMMQRRWAFTLKERLPSALVNTIAEYKLNSKFDHDLYALKPAHRFDGQHVMINDDLPNAIAAGTVIVKPNVRRLTERDVEFDDGTVVKDVDAVIYATGYVFGFPFVDHPSLTVTDNKVSLYKLQFPPDIQPSTLAVIGCFQPLGAIFPISEMQCRWATRVFKGETPLPTAADMWRDIELKTQDMAKRYYASQRHTIQVDYVPFMDELAELVGCRPNIWQVFKSDPRLAFRMFFGPCTPYQFRLTGHGSWPGARHAIMTTWERTERPFKTRSVPENNCSFRRLVVFFALAILVVAILYSWLL